MTERAKNKTGDSNAYNPEGYWDERSQTYNSDSLSSVCLINALRVENLSAHKVQLSAIDTLIKKLTLSGKSVLEYGCGHGRWIDYFIGRNAIWYGVDISENMLKLVRNSYPSVDVRKVEQSYIPHEDQSMDFAYSVTVLHHNSYESQEQIARELSRVVKPGGYLMILEDVDTNSIGFNMFPRTRSAWLDLFEKNDFVVMKHIGVKYWIVRSALMMLYKAIRQITNGNKADERSISNINNNPGYARKVVGWIDLVVDPYIYMYVPKRYQGSTLILFQKKGGAINGAS